jgi:hypothetical protein
MSERIITVSLEAWVGLVDEVKRLRADVNERQQGVCKMTRVDAFLVQGTDIRPDGETRTFTIGVVASGLEDAIKAFRVCHPDAKLWGISHRSRIEIITADAANGTVSGEEVT